MDLGALSHEIPAKMSLSSLLHVCLCGFLLALAMNGTEASARTPKADVPEYCPEDPASNFSPVPIRTQRLQIEQLLREGGNPNQCFAETSALMRAADMDDLKTVRRLLDAGAHPDRPKSPGSTLTPLMLVVGGRGYDIALLLLSRGADPRAIDKTNGQTLLHELAFGPRAIADRSEELEIAQIVRKAGISVNARNAIRMTPIYLAVRNVDQSLVAWLLYQGADPKLKDHEGRDAFSAARDREGESATDIRKKEQILLMLETEPLARLLRQGKTAEFGRAFKHCAPEKTAHHTPRC